MCNLSKGVEEKAAEKVTLKLISNLMDTMNLPAEQAMSKLKIPETEYKKYLSQLGQQCTAANKIHKEPIVHILKKSLSGWPFLMAD